MQASPAAFNNLARVHGVQVHAYDFQGEGLEAITHDWLLTFGSFRSVRQAWLMSLDYASVNSCERIDDEKIDNVKTVGKDLYLG
ncbi:MAG: hypothetical protein A4E49_01508 [Methanosaeta sp. PtaU1.Bin112]|nr:MAG: hypothetical protein A4E49_01508 [Methanosaeta sp. PtaU1.Bin112]